ncbi:hypothetical protein ACEPAF_1210 [Sanghuangporus sanghuang]
MKSLALSSLILLAWDSLAQTINEIWETTADQKSLLKSVTSANFTFGSNVGSGDGEIDVDDGTVYQTIFGFGATLTDASAYILNKLKGKDAGAYAALLKSMFDATPGAHSASINYVRVAIGASDFSPKDYSFIDEKDPNLSSFSVDVAPSYLYSTLEDIKVVNKNIRIHLVPWSPPGWMKDSGSMNAGNFLEEYTDTMAHYLLKSAQGFESKGFRPYAISIQNEPESQNPTLPSCLYTTKAQAGVAVSLRKLLNSNGMNDVKVIGYEHNWDNAAAYASELMREDGASDAFSGVAFHCYGGNVEQQDDWHNSFPDKELYFTECTGTVGSDFWNDIKWTMNNIFIGGLKHWAQTGLMWNLVVDPEGNPKLPGASSCGNGCRGVVQIESDGKVQLNQEYYAMGHAAKAILSGNQPTKRIKVNVNGDALLGGAYSNGSGFSLVVLNSGDDYLKTSIKFRGKTAMYTFPVGLTTMSWSA